MRLLLLLVTNVAVIAVAFLAVTLTGLPAPVGGVLGVCLALGMGGAFLSLLTSKWAIRRATRAKIVKPGDSPGGDWLLVNVRDLAEIFDVAMPKVAVYPSLSMNAFATGPSRDLSLIHI